MPKEKKLTVKQEKFCQEYVKTLNASEAYRRAYKPQRMKQANIWEEGSRRMALPHVATRIAKLQAEVSKRNDITVDRIVQELAKIGFSNTANLFNDDGTPKQTSELDKDTQRSIAEVVTTTTNDDTVITRFKLHDKVKALDLLMKHLGGYNNDTSQKNTIVVVGATL